MDIKELEKDELVDLAAMLSARLGKSVETELALAIRVKGLERAVDDARKRALSSGTVEELRTAQERARKAERLLDNGRDEIMELNDEIHNLSNELEAAKAQWEKSRKELQNILEDRDQAKQQREHLQKEVLKMLDQMSQMRSDLSVAHINACAGERRACMDIARNIALACATAGESSACMQIVNLIGARA